MEAFKGQKDMSTWVIEATEFDSEVKCDLRGRLEAAMATEATKMAVKGNVHIDTRVIEVAVFKSEVKFDFWDHLLLLLVPCLSLAYAFRSQFIALVPADQGCKELTSNELSS